MALDRAVEIAVVAESVPLSPREIAGAGEMISFFGLSHVTMIRSDSDRDRPGESEGSLTVHDPLVTVVRTPRVSACRSARGLDRAPCRLRGA